VSASQTITISARWAAALQSLDPAEREAFVEHALEAALTKLTSQSALKAQHPDPCFSPAELEAEQWKIISDFPEFEVSTLGRVRRLRSTRAKTGWCIQRGYRQIELIAGNKKQRFLIQRLVAEAFLPNPQRKDHVNHKDGDKANNRLSNLEWTTVKENNEHASATGLRPSGAKHPMAIRASDAGAALRRAKRKLGGTSEPRSPSP
jgi:hypothetical protein